MYTPAQVAAKIDHAALKPNFTDADIENHAKMCVARGVFSLCVRPCDVSLATRCLRGSRVLVGAVIGEALPEMDYEARKRTLLAHRIGLWDVIGRCVREGSLDADIRRARHNDFLRVTGAAKKLRRIFFNGQTAGKFETQFAAWGYETAVLPSSSPAYTLRFEEKLKAWRALGLPSPTRRVARGRGAAVRAPC